MQQSYFHRDVRRDASYGKLTIWQWLGVFGYFVLHMMVSILFFGSLYMMLFGFVGAVLVYLVLANEIPGRVKRWLRYMKASKQLRLPEFEKDKSIYLLANHPAIYIQVTPGPYIPGVYDACLTIWQAIMNNLLRENITWSIFTEEVSDMAATKLRADRNRPPIENPGLKELSDQRKIHWLQSGYTDEVITIRLMAIEDTDDMREVLRTQAKEMMQTLARTGAMCRVIRDVEADDRRMLMPYEVEREIRGQLLSAHGLAEIPHAAIEPPPADEMVEEVAEDPPAPFERESGNQDVPVVGMELEPERTADPDPDPVVQEHIPPSEPMETLADRWRKELTQKQPVVEEVVAVDVQDDPLPVQENIGPSSVAAAETAPAANRVVVLGVKGGVGTTLIARSVAETADEWKVSDAGGLSYLDEMLPKDAVTLLVVTPDPLAIQAVFAHRSNIARLPNCWLLFNRIENGTDEEIARCLASDVGLPLLPSLMEDDRVAERIVRGEIPLDVGEQIKKMGGRRVGRNVA